MVGGWWRLAVGGWRRLMVGGGRLVAVGGWRLVVLWGIPSGAVLNPKKIGVLKDSPDCVTVLLESAPWASAI